MKVSVEHDELVRILRMIGDEAIIGYCATCDFWRGGMGGCINPKIIGMSGVAEESRRPYIEIKNDDSVRFHVPGDFGCRLYMKTKNEGR